MSKAKAYSLSAAPAKLEWRLTRFPACMLCGSEGGHFPLAVHEIERRGHAPTRWANPANYILCCTSCHEGPLATMPHAEQLAWKSLKDSDNYDLQAWLRIKDPGLRAPNRVTQDEVDSFLERLRPKRTASRPS